MSLVLYYCLKIANLATDHSMHTKTYCLRAMIISSFIACVATFVSCDQKSTLDVPASKLSSLSTKAGAGEGCDLGFFVTKDMVTAFLKMEKSDKAVLSVEGYPSEESPAMYVVNYEEGWKVFPADSRFGIILAENPKEHLNLWEKSDNEGFELWMGSLQEQIERFRGLPMDEYDESAVRFWDTLRPKPASRTEEILSSLRNNPRNRDLWAIIEVGTVYGDTTLANRNQLLSTKWGQGHPWNVSMPYVYDSLYMYDKICKAGSQAVAVGQVLKYFHGASSIPSGLYHQVSEASRAPVYSSGVLLGVTLTLNRSNFTSNSSRWNQMSSDCPSLPHVPTSGDEYVSDFLLDIGARLGTMYNIYYSYTNTDVNGYLDLSPTNLSYSQAVYNSSMVNTVVSNLSNWSPVIMSAKNYGPGYHYFWVIDGYQHKQYYTQTNYESWPISMLYEMYSYDQFTLVNVMGEEALAGLYPNYYPGMSFYTREDYNDYLEYHMNWGNDGYNDGMFSAYSSGWNGYTIDTRVYYNLVPGELIIN